MTDLKRYDTRRLKRSIHVDDAANYIFHNIGGRCIGYPVADEIDKPPIEDAEFEIIEPQQLPEPPKPEG